MAQTIAVLSQKGGTGKTTTVRTLTDVLRRSGARTLAVDLDPQGNLSDYFDVPPDAQPTIGDVLSGRAPAPEAIHGDVIPANLNLAETELALGAMRAVAGPDRVRDDMRPVMGSEDFAFILRKVPGAYIFVGNGDTAGLHNPKYDFNDAILAPAER